MNGLNQPVAIGGDISEPNRATLALIGRAPLRAFAPNAAVRCVNRQDVFDVLVVQLISNGREYQAQRVAFARSLAFGIDCVDYPFWGREAHHQCPAKRPVPQR